MNPSQEFLKRELIHYLSDSVSLLGGSKEFVLRLREFSEKPLTSEIIEEIKNFNTTQIDLVKTRLYLLNTISINSNP